MRLLFLTPGTGSYHCGVCMRDNALAKHLIAQGHDAILLPMYLPLTLDESAANPSAPVFFGGLNVYLQQRFAWFRNAPRWLDDTLNHPSILKLLGQFSSMTRSATTGELTHSMLLGENGNQRREIDKLLEWIRSLPNPPDAIFLSTGLLAGLAAPLRRATGAPVITSLQGEDSFLDGLPGQWKDRCWNAFRNALDHCDRLLAPSTFFARLMETRMSLPSGTIHGILNGMDFSDFPTTPPRSSPPDPRNIRVGFFARLSHGKGLGHLVDAFIAMQPAIRQNIRLLCGGSMTADDQSYVNHLKQRLAAADLLDQVEFHPNLDREQKIQFLSKLDALCVPAHYGEAFGLYLIEAMACGVPVIQPQTAAFPEVLEAMDDAPYHATHSHGFLYPDPNPENPATLASALESAVKDLPLLYNKGLRSQTRVRERFSLERMAKEFVSTIRPPKN
jgi:glycosyltransferase involved in cell wall biosynthesis